MEPPVATSSERPDPPQRPLPGPDFPADWLLDTMPCGVLVIDEQHTIRRANQQAARWCGIQPEALLNQPLAALHLPPEAHFALLQLLEPDAGAPREVVLPEHDLWLALSAARQPGGWVLYGQDITPQKRREQQYQALAENTPDVLTRWGPDLRLRYANAAFAAKAGVPLSELLGRTTHEMGQPAAVATPYMAALQRTFDTGQPQEHFTQLPTPQGTAYYYSRIVPELRDGEVETVLSIARDITQLKQAEAEAVRLQGALARRVTDKYYALFYGMDQGFCVLEILFDSTGQQAVDFRYLELNPVFAQQSGMPEGAQGHTARELLPDLEAFWFDTYGRVALTGKPVRVEHHVPQVGRWFDVHAFRVGAPEARQVAVLFNDITARKHTEAVLRQAAEAETFRLRLADALSPLADPLAIQKTVTHLARTHFGADRCYYCEIEGGQAIIRRDAAEGLPSVAGTYPLADFALLRAALEAGRPFIVRDVRHDKSVDENLRQLCLQLQVISYLNIPLIKNGRPAGVLCLVQSTPREWAAEVALAAETAERAWAAVERARIEEELRASQANLAAVFEALPVGVALVDAHGNLILTNHRMQQYLPTGRMPSLDDAQYLRWRAYDSGGRRLPRSEFPGARALRGEKVVPGIEMSYVQENGQEIWTQVIAVPFTGSDGQVAGHVTVIIDIDAQKRTEEDLRLSEERLQLALQAGQMGSFEWSSEGNRITLSPMSEQVLGLLPGTAFRTSDAGFALVHPADRARQQAVFEQAGRAGSDFHSIYRIVRPRDGQVRWVEERGQGTRNPATGSTCLRGVHWDVTEQVEAQQQLAEFNSKLEQRVARRTQALQASRDLLQSVFDTNLIAMSVLEAVRDETGAVEDFRLRLVSRELERETGRTDLVGKLYSQEYPGIREVGIFDLAMRALETGEPQGMEYYYTHEGFNKWFSCQFVKLDDGVVATNLDITERKTAEQERTKNLRLLEQAEAVAGLGSWDYELATNTMHWSDGMYHLFGLPLGSVVEPRRYLEVVLDEDRPRAEQLVQQLSAGSRGFEDTLRLRVNEQIKTVRMKAVVLHNDAGQPVRVLGVDLDISQLQRLEADNLRLRLTQQHALFEAVQAAQEAERKHMAESLHNGIGQILYATKLRIDRLHTPLLGTDPALVAARQEADQLLSEAIRQTRVLSHELVPMVLEEFGLAAALQDIGTKMSTPQLRLRSHLLLDNDAAPLAPALQLALYRMAQELAQNIVKHARGATEASLDLETMPGWVLLRAEDNGAGFAQAAANSRGLGLRSIRDRVALLGGQLEIGTAPASGAYVRIRIPLPPVSPSP